MLLLEQNNSVFLRSIFFSSRCISDLFGILSIQSESWRRPSTVEKLEALSRALTRPDWLSGFLSVDDERFCAVPVLTVDGRSSPDFTSLTAEIPEWLGSEKQCAVLSFSESVMGGIDRRIDGRSNRLIRQLRVQPITDSARGYQAAPYYSRTVFYIQFGGGVLYMKLAPLASGRPTDRPGNDLSNKPAGKICVRPACEHSPILLFADHPNDRRSQRYTILFIQKRYGAIGPPTRQDQE